MPQIVPRELSKCLCFVPNWHTCVMWRIQCWMWPTPWMPTSSKCHWWPNVIQHPATMFCTVWQLAAMRQLVCICYPNRDVWITRVMLRLSNVGSKRTKAERENSLRYDRNMQHLMALMHTKEILESKHFWMYSQLNSAPRAPTQSIRPLDKITSAVAQPNPAVISLLCPLPGIRDNTM